MRRGQLIKNWIRELRADAEFGSTIILAPPVQDEDGTFTVLLAVKPNGKDPALAKFIVSNADDANAIELRLSFVFRERLKVFSTVLDAMLAANAAWPSPTTTQWVMNARQYGTP